MPRTETTLLNKDFGATPENLNVNVDGFGSYKLIWLEWDGIACTQAIRWRFRSGGATISTSGYYWRNGVGGGTFLATADAGYITTTGTTSGTSAGRGLLRIRRHASAADRTLALVDLGMSSTLGQLEEVSSDVAAVHDGLNIYVDGAANITAGTMRMLGINF